MVTRRRTLTFGSAAVLIFSAALFAQQTEQKARKLSDAEKKEFVAAMKLADDALAGKVDRNDLNVTWIHEDVLKASGNKQYLPFSVTLDPSKVSGGKFAIYWRAVPKAAEATDDKKKKDKVEYPYEDLNIVNVPSGSPMPMRLDRSFTVEPGEYDIYVVAKELEKSGRNATPPMVSVLKHPLTVPDFWNGELNTSTVIVAERIDPLPAPLTPEQQGLRPYALGTMEIVPASSTNFTKQAELSTFILIYNAKTDSANKPDVSVEYNFYAKEAGGEKFFNKTNPQNLNAQTLPPEFDFAAGHQLQSGQAVPLASFPAGDYRLEIKITDKIASKTLTRDVNFSVSGS